MVPVPGRDAVGQIECKNRLQEAPPDYVDEYEASDVYSHPIRVDKDDSRRKNDVEHAEEEGDGYEVFLSELKPNDKVFKSQEIREIDADQYEKEDRLDKQVIESAH